MRKRYKLKLRSCGLCKPHKRGWDHRWKAKELQLVEFAEREVRSSLRRTILHAGLPNKSADRQIKPRFVGRLTRAPGTPGPQEGTTP